LVRLLGRKIGKHVILHHNCHLGPNLTIGHGSLINTQCLIETNAPVLIGSRVHLGMRVLIATSIHDMSDPACRSGLHSALPVVIGDGAWIGGGATIMPGVTIGAGAVIGAASVVVRDVPPDTVWAGNPARFIRSLAEPASGVSDRPAA